MIKRNLNERSQAQANPRAMSLSKTIGRFFGSLLLALPAVWLPMSAQAVDGVLEINQTCATETGCFLGDEPGFPVTITRRGSYRLTGNLRRSGIFGVVDTNRVEVTSDNVTIDLNGFGIVCTETILVIGGGGGTSPKCSGTADGINSTGEGLIVRNGIVSGWGGEGIQMDDHSTLRNVTVRHSGRNGVMGGNGTLIEGCTVSDNGIDGITAGLASRIASTVVHDNDRDGVRISFAGLVRDSVLYNNGRNGIVSSPGGRISHNTFRSNGNFGLSTSPDSGYDNNTFTGGDTVNGGHRQGGNSCDGGVCP